MTGRFMPGPGQESVWDYPRPPRVERSRRRARVLHAGAVIADSTRALRVLETSHPPGIYIPRGDVAEDRLLPEDHTTVCEFKGAARYWAVSVGGHVASGAAWSYPEPWPGYEAIAGHFSFYPGRVDVCLLDDEVVAAQEGGFYGGWITTDIVGPFKGAPGTTGW
jgi:uncharacterized protein (DUF427 family)